MFAPPLIGGIGLGLAEVFVCSGGAGQINHCLSFDSLAPSINALASIGLLSIASLPLGAIALVLIALFGSRRELRK